MTRIHVARPVHPLTGRQIRLTARDPRKLAQLVSFVRGLKEELRVGARSAEEVNKVLRRLVSGAVTVARAAEAYCARGDVAEDTRRRVRSFVAPGGAGGPLALLELDALDARTCARWLERRRARGAAPATVAQAWTTLRAIVRYAAERGWIDRSPWGAWRPTVRGSSRRLPRECCRSPAELEQLIAAADLVGGVDVGDKIAIAAGLGLRARELALLAWDSVDLERGVAWIASSRKNEPASVAIPPWLGARLGRIWTAHQHLDGAAGRTVVGGRFRGEQAAPREVLSREELRRAVREAGLPHERRWSPHSLRDTFVTLEHRRNGGDLAATARASRHTSLASLVRYLRELDRGGTAPPLLSAAKEATPP